MSIATPSTAGPSELRAAPSYAGKWTKLSPALTPWVLSLLADMGFAQMTPVQASTIPLFLSHKDVIVEAVTGSGKTLAFVIPVLEMLLRRTSKLKKDEVGALIVSPTRELAEQIHKVIATFLDAQTQMEEAQAAAAATAEEEDEATSSEEDSDSDSDTPAARARAEKRKRKAAQAPKKTTRIAGAQLVVGGSKSTPLDDYRTFRDGGADILVGTPGRLEELLSRKGVKKSELDVLVLDEADRLLDLGFTEHLRRILSLLPKQRRTGLFSATMTDALSELVRIGLRNPVRVVVKVEAKNKAAAGAKASSSKAVDESRRTPASLQNLFQVSRPENKLAQLVRILLFESSDKGMSGGARKFIVYFSTCAQVNYFHSVLSQLALFKQHRIKLHALHGKQTPSKRKSMFEAFVASTSLDGASERGVGGATVLFCTDVAARGLDLPDVEVVVQYDPPTDPKVFSHRCGRTARAGRRGRAIVMLHAGREEDLVSYLAVKRIPLAPYPYLSAELEGAVEPTEEEGDRGARELEADVRAMVKADREVWELSVRAYVSYTRAYSKHEMSYIFRLAELDLGAVAHAFGLIRLPAMPELKARKAAGLVYDEESFDLAQLAYRDKTKEKARQAKIQAERDAPPKPSKDDEESDDSTAAKPRAKKDAVAGAWSAQKERRQMRDLRREKRARKRAFLKSQPAPTSEKADGQQDDDEQEDDWNEDYRQLKKHKRAKNKPSTAPSDDFNSNSDSDGNTNAPEEPFFVI